MSLPLKGFRVIDLTKLLPGPIAYKLYDTFGFPVDLQEVIGAEHGFGIDHEGFGAEMQRARERSAGSKVGDRAVDAPFIDPAQVTVNRLVQFRIEGRSETIVELGEPAGQLRLDFRAPIADAEVE